MYMHFFTVVVILGTGFGSFRRQELPKSGLPLDRPEQNGSGSGVPLNRPMVRNAGRLFSVNKIPNSFEH